MVWEEREIGNEALSMDDVPAPESGWDVLQRFALTFDGYAYWGGFDSCGKIANECAGLYERDSVIPTSLEYLRTALFFEQRRFRHLGWDPDEETMKYIRALVAGIQEIVGRREMMEFELAKPEAGEVQA